MIRIQKSHLVNITKQKCYQSVNTINYPWSQSDHIKRLLLLVDWGENNIFDKKNLTFFEYKKKNFVTMQAVQ